MSCGAQVSLRLHAAGSGVALQSPPCSTSTVSAVDPSNPGAVEPCETGVRSLGRGPVVQVQVPHTLTASFNQQLIGPLRAQVGAPPPP
jgi:hypothetical protein